MLRADLYVLLLISDRDEHRKGAPNCPFFTLSKAAPSRKKAARASSAGRTSNVSRASTRLSTQSILSVASEAPTLASLDEEETGDVSLSSIATGISTATTATGKKKAGRPKKVATAVKAKRGRPKKEKSSPSKAIEEPEDDDFEVKVVQAPKAAKVTKATKGKKRKSEEMDVDEITEPQKATKSRKRISKEAGGNLPGKSERQTSKQVDLDMEDASELLPEPVSSPPKPKKRATKTKKKSEMDEAPKPRKRVVSRAKPPKKPEPASPARQVTPSPSPASPQTSDAENQPPSVISRSSLIHSVQKARTPFSTADTPLNSRYNESTPTRLEAEPSLKWTTADLETIFLKSPSSRRSGEVEKENMGLQSLDDAIEGVKGALTSPEKRMTVEEWIKFNAHIGEQRLRADCERLVGLFEKEGNRALQALEGISVVAGRR